MPVGRRDGVGGYEKPILIDDAIVLLGSRNLAWTSICTNFEFSACSRTRT